LLGCPAAGRYCTGTIGALESAVTQPGLPCAFRQSELVALGMLVGAFNNNGLTMTCADLKQSQD
jgi:hypothetical protein